MIPRAAIDPATGAVRIVSYAQAAFPLSKIGSFSIDKNNAIVVSG